MKIINSILPRSNPTPQESINGIVSKISKNDGKTINNIVGIVNFPVEIHYRIANYLDATSYANLRETCKTFRNNLESFHMLNEISTNKIYSGELKKRSINIIKQRQSSVIQNDRDIMGAITNLKVSLTKVQEIYLYSISFMTRIDINKEKKEKLHAPLKKIANLYPSQISGSYAESFYNTNIGFSIKSYDFYYVLNPPSEPIASEPPIKIILESLQNDWDKSETSDKYLIAAYAEKIINSCQEIPMLGINQDTLNEMREQYTLLISTGKFINSIAQQQRAHYIDYLKMSDKDAFVKAILVNDHQPTVDCCLQK